MLRLPPPFANTHPSQPGAGQRVRRRRADVAVEQHPHRGAHRNPPGRAGALGDRPRRCNGRSDRPDPAGRAGRGGRRDRARSRRTGLPVGAASICWPGRSANGACRTAAGCCCGPGGALVRSDEAAFLNADENGPHTPGPSVAAARWLADGAFDHRLRRGDGRHRRRQCRRNGSAVPGAQLPARRRHLRADPAAESRPAAHHRGRAGRDAVADRRGHAAARPAWWRWSSTRCSRTDAGRRGRSGRTLARLGVGHVFGVVGSGNFAMTNALRAAGVPFVAARHEGGAASMADALRPDERPGRACCRCIRDRADQRRHRHHRGGEEPHADAGAGRRRRGLRGALELPHRHRRTGRRHGRGPGAGALGRVGRRRCGPRLADGPQHPPHRGPQRSPGRAGPVGGAAAGPAAPASGADPVREVRDEAVG